MQSTGTCAGATRRAFSSSFQVLLKGILDGGTQGPDLTRSVCIPPGTLHRQGREVGCVQTAGPNPGLASPECLFDSLQENTWNLMLIEYSPHPSSRRGVWTHNALQVCLSLHSQHDKRQSCQSRRIEVLGFESVRESSDPRLDGAMVCLSCFRTLRLCSS